MSFFLVYLAIVLIAATLWAGAGGRGGVLRSLRRGSEPAADKVRENPILFPGFGQPPPNLPPVLLPADAEPADLDRLRFSLGLRGYRMDQVDQVLDELRDQIAAKDEEMGRLRARLLEVERAAPPKAGS